MKKPIGGYVALVIVGLLIIVSPLLFPIDWAHGKSILYVYIAVCLGIAVLKAKRKNKLTKTVVISAIVVYVYIAYLLVTTLANYPIGIISFM